MTPGPLPSQLAQARQFLQTGQLDQAEALARQVLEAQPGEAEAFRILGFVAAYQGHLEPALALLRRAIGLNPTKAPLYENLAVILASADRFGEAETVLRQALALQPNFPQAWNHLGLILMDQRRNLEAKDAFVQALTLAPGDAEAINNLGVIQHLLGRIDEALASFQRAVQIDPRHEDAQVNIWLIRQEMGQIQESLSAYERILVTRPNNAKAHCHRGLVLLTLGRWREGWADYEWRSRLKGWEPSPSQTPLWDGRSFAGKKLLLLAEQGIGDNFMALRFARQVKERGGQVWLRCSPQLHPLLQSAAGIDRLLSSSDPVLPGHDRQLSLMSLPRVLEVTPATVPTPIPYLHPRADLVEEWRTKLEAYPGFRVGIAWQGSTQFLNDPNRSIPLAQFEPLAMAPGVRLISLQVGPGREQLGRQNFPVVDLGRALDLNHGAFMDTAAIVKNLDLVISSDTSVPHLAGALGAPVWLALGLVPDWRWLLDREDSPWYPTMRLFRQKQRGQWDEVFARMAEMLQVLGAPKK